MPKKGKSSIGRSLKRRKAPDAHLPSSEQTPTSSQHPDDMSYNPDNSFNQNEPSNFMEQPSLRVQHEPVPSTSNVNMVDWNRTDNIDHMDCTEPTAVRMYENGALVVDANVVFGNAIQPEPSSTNYNSTTPVIPEDTPSNENAKISEFRAKLGCLPASDK